MTIWCRSEFFWCLGRLEWKSSFVFFKFFLQQKRLAIRWWLGAWCFVKSVRFNLPGLHMSWIVLSCIRSSSQWCLISHDLEPLGFINLVRIPVDVLLSIMRGKSFVCCGWLKTCPQIRRMATRFSEFSKAPPVSASAAEDITRRRALHSVWNRPLDVIVP